MKNLIKTSYQVKKLLKKYNKKKLLIITGKKSFIKSGAKNIFSVLKKDNVNYFFKRSNIPEIKELNKIITLIRKLKPKYIFSVGGGAVMDLAKTSNYLWNTKNIKKTIIKSKYGKQKNYCPLVAIPTTAGSGAEVTSNAVIYLNKKKYSVENKLIRPKSSFLIPELIKKNSFKLKSASGFDAIAQAVESLLSVKSNKKSYNYAVDSLMLSLKNYSEYLKKPNSLNSKNMIKAANLAGEAINISKTTAPHALSYPFTSHFGISHGHAVAITFNEFLEYNYNNKNLANTDLNLDKKFKTLFKISQTQNIFELIKFFKDIEQKAKIKINFNELKIDVSKNINLILKNVNIQRLSNNPVSLDYEKIKRLLLNKK